MNKSGNENRSVRSTKKKLKECLISLLHERPINEISVKELTELADVNRGTFYFHYEDIYALMREMEDSFFEEFSLAMDSCLPTVNTARSYLLQVFTVVGQNSELCGILLGKHGDMHFLEKIYDFLNEKCSFIWTSVADLPDRGGDEPDRNKVKLYNSFILNGCIGMVKYWLENGMKETPDDITDLALASIVSSARAYNII